MNTYEGKVNIDFWNKALYYDYTSGGSGILMKDGFTGWLKHFFYYDSYGNQIYLEEEYVVKINKLRSSVIYTPVHFSNLLFKFETDLRFLAGFEGYAEIGKLNFRPI